MQSSNLREHLAGVLDGAGLAGGRVAELGSPGSVLSEELPGHDWHYLSAAGDGDRPDVTLADITHCPQIAGESYDVVLSIGVLERLPRPWAAAKEITRILKPGGVVYHAGASGDFSPRAAGDLWRVSPQGLVHLFAGLEVLCAEVIDETTPLDLRPDAGAGRRTPVFAGRKSRPARRRLARQRTEQLVVDMVALLTELGVEGDVVYEHAADLIAQVRLTDEGELRLRSTPADRIKTERIRDLWRRRDELGLRPGPGRAVLRTLLDS